MSEAITPVTLPAAIVFDMDGVLADTERLKFRAHRTAVEAVGGSLEADLYVRHMGSAHLGVIRAFLSASELDTSSDSVEAYEERFQAAYRKLLATDLRAMPGARALLERCRNGGRPLALVTSSERWMADIVLRALVRRDCSSVPGVRHALGAPEVFETMVTADDVENEKPDPEPYLKARRALTDSAKARGDADGRSGTRVEAEHRPIVAVEDTPAGVESATAAGLPVIAVRHDFNRKRSFEGAAAVIESLDPPDAFLALADEVSAESATDRAPSD